MQRVRPRGRDAAEGESSKICGEIEPSPSKVERARWAEPKLWATADAAKALAVSRQRVAQLVTTGQLLLFAQTPGGQMLFEPATVYALKRRRAPQRWAFRRAFGTIHPGRLQMAKAKIEQLSIDNRRPATSRKNDRIA